jgi:hypothetical protein
MLAICEVESNYILPVLLKISANGAKIPEFQLHPMI